MKKIQIWLGVILLGVASWSSATEWMVEEVKLNAKASRCLARSSAEDEASQRLRLDTDSSCRQKGYGWHLESVKSQGQLVCNDCDGVQLERCQIVDVVVACRRLKPGSVGIMGVPFFSQHD